MFITKEKEENNCIPDTNKLTLLDLKNIFDGSNGINSSSSVNIIEVSSVNKILREDSLKIMVLTDEMIKDILSKNNRLLLYRYRDVVRPNKIIAIEIHNEIRESLYKCNKVEFKYEYDKTYGKKIEIVKGVSSNE